MRFFRESFRRKVVTSFMLAFVAAWAVGGLAVWTVLSESLISQAFNQMESTTGAFSLIIQELLENAERSYLQGVAQSVQGRIELLATQTANGVKTEQQAQTELETILAMPGPKNQHCFFIALDTRQVPGRVLLRNVKNATDQDVTDRDYVRTMLAQQRGFAKFVWTDPADGRQHPVSAWFEHFDSLGVILAVMSYREDLPGLLTFSDLQTRLANLTVGNTGYFFVLDEEGTMLIHPRWVGQNVRTLVDPISGSNLYEGIIVNIRSRQQQDGSQQVVGKLKYHLPDPQNGKPVQKILFYRVIPSLRWVLGTVMETSEIEEPLRAASLLFAASLLGSLIFCLIVVYRLTRPLFSQVEALTKAAQSLGEGHLDTPLPKPSDDEVGVLVAAFASMSDRLTAHTANLEARVHERTKDLQASRSEMALFKAAVDASPASIAIIDAEGRLEYANSAYNRMAGGIGLETLGLPPIFLDAIRAEPEKVYAVQQAVAQKRHWQGDMIAEGHGPQARRLKMAMAPVIDDLSQMHFVAVMEDVTERFNLEAELLNLASTDSLTGLPNRRRLLGRLDEELRQARRFGHDVAIIMLDLDRFKSINDTFGHGAGDLILKEAAKALNSCLREVDMAGRLGGEEFCVLLPYTGLPGALALAERIRAKIEGLRVLTPAGDYLRVTVSAGVASCVDPGGLPTMESLLSRADAALYEAKHRGRNQVYPMSKEGLIDLGFV